MDTGQAVDLVRHSLIMALTVSAPMLLIGLVVGIVISLLQAVTQIQEQTLSFIPKVAASILVLVALGPWMLRYMIEFTQTLILSMVQYSQ